MEVTFWDIFWPVFSALLCATIIFESIHICIALWRNKQQVAKFKEQLKAQGIDPSQVDIKDLFGGSYLPDITIDETTTNNTKATSDSEKPDTTLGQYV